MSILRQSFWAAFAAIIGASYRFALSASMAHTLSIEEFANFSYLIWIADISSLIGSFGLTNVFSRYYAESAERKELAEEIELLWRRAIFIQPVVCAIAAIIVSTLSFGLDNPQIAGLSALMAIGNAAWILTLSKLSGLRDFKVISSGLLLQAIVAFASLFALAHAGYLNLYAAGLVISMGSFVAATSASVAVKGNGVGRGRRSDVRMPNGEMRKYALNTWISSLLYSLAWTRGEFPIVKQFVTPAEFAHYSAAFSLSGGATQFVMLAVGAVLPNITKKVSEGDSAAVSRILKGTATLQVALMPIAILPFILFGKPLMSVCFGDGYSEGSSALVLLSFGLWGLTVASQGHLLQIKSNGVTSRNITLVSVLLLYLTALILTPLFGVLGAGVGRLIAVAVMFFLTLRCLSASRSDDYPLRYAVLSCLLLVMVAVLWLMNEQWASAVAVALSALLCLFSLAKVRVAFAVVR